MATSGQILDILGKLEKGSAKVERQEKGAKKKEKRHHRSMLQKLSKEMSKASKLAKKSEKWGSRLSLLASLTGAGLPAVVAAQFIGSYFGGKQGAKKAEEYMKGVEGFRGTKFGTEKKAYEREIGADVFANALTKAAITAGTSYIGGRVTGELEKYAGRAKEGLGKIFGEKTAEAGGKSDVLKKMFEAKTPLGKLSEKVPEEMTTGDKLAKLIASKPSRPGVDIAKEDILQELGGKTLPVGTPYRLPNEAFNPNQPVSPLNLPYLQKYKAPDPGGEFLNLNPKGRPGQFQSLISKELSKTPPSEWASPLTSKKMTGAGIAKLLGADAGDKMLGRLISSIAERETIKKRPSIFDYELPASLGRPTSGFGGYY